MKTGKRHRPNSNSDIEGPPPPSVENRNVSKQIIAEMSQYLDKLSTINQSDRFHLEIELRLGIHMGKSFRSGVRMYTLYYSSNTPSRSQKNFLMNIPLLYSLTRLRALNLMKVIIKLVIIRITIE